MRMRVFLLPVLVFMAPLSAWATPAAVSTFFPPIQPGGVRVHLSPLVTIPAESAQAPLARVTEMQQLTDGSGRMFFNRTDGVLYAAVPGGGTAQAYLDINAQGVPAPSGGALNGPGFTGFAFSPNFGQDASKSGYATFYTATVIPGAGGDLSAPTTEIREWTATDPRAAVFSGTSRLLMEIPVGNVAMMAFNPTAQPGSSDYGKLYFGSGWYGDYTDDPDPPSPGSLHGTIIRIDPTPGPDRAPYTIPSDNPFVGVSGARGEIWAYGLRNPQTFGWDAITGTMYINDIGEGTFEEVNVGRAGANYGWPLREGIFATGRAYGVGGTSVYPVPVPNSVSGFSDPIAGYTHDEGHALGSGFVYRGTAIPALTGMYVMQDIVNGRIFYFDPAQVIPGQLATLREVTVTDGSSTINLADTIGYGNPWNDGNRADTRLQQGADGTLYDVSKSTGVLYEIVPDAVPEPGRGVLVTLGLLGLGSVLCRVRAGGKPQVWTRRPTA